MGLFLNKKTVFLCALFLGLFFSVHTAEAGTLVRPPNNLGLVSYWNFNEGTSTIATDYSGNGNTGTLTNSPTWTTGKFDQGLQFSGSRYVLVPTDNGFTNKATGTISVWFFATSTSDNQHLWRSGQVSSDAPSVYTTGGVLSYHNFSQEITVATMTSLVGNWHHIVSTWTSAGRTVYLDGVQVGTGMSPTAWGTGFHIGSNNNDAASWIGKIDDVRMYSRALTATQVSALYNSGASKFGGSNALTQGSLNDGLMAHWTYDGADVATTVADRSGQSQNGYFVGGATSSAKVTGKLGQALNFDGVDDYTIATSSGTSLTQLAVSFWVKPSGNDATQRGMFQWSYGLNSIRPFILVTRDTTNEVRFWVDGNYRLSNVVIPSDSWSHVTVILNTANLWTFYVDGVSVGTYQDDANHAWQSTAGSIYVGNGYNGYFPGSVDDVRVYSRSLSTAEIVQLYGLSQGKTNASSTALSRGSTLATGLVGLWTFDGQDTLSSITDRSGQGNNAYISGVATSSAKIIGKFGQALTFDGVNDVLSLPNFASQFTNEGTYNVWVKLPIHTPTPNQGSWFLGSTDSCSHYPWDGDGNIYDGTFRSARVTVGVGTIADRTQWHMVTITSTPGAGGWKFYQNGSLVTSATGDASITFPTAPLIARSNSACSFYFNGILDDARLYNRSLSASEVRQLYLMGN